METYEIVSRRVKKTGITVSELARRTGINQFLLRRTLLGERGMKADELIKLNRELGLEMSDFSEVA